MAVTAYWYGNAFLSAFNKEVDFNEASKIKAALVTSSYTFDQDTHDYFDDITNEVSESGTNYTAGGAILASCTVGYTAGTNVVKFDATDPSWATSTITARGCVIYYTTGTASTSPLLIYIDFGGNMSSSSGTFSIVFHTDGIATVTVGAPA